MYFKFTFKGYFLLVGGVGVNMFDEVLNRRNTNSAKWEESMREILTEEMITLSIADMDFRAPAGVVSKLVEAASHGIYGYTNLSERYYRAVQEWMSKSYDWEVKKEWIVFCPRIIQAVSVTIQNFTEVGDKVLIQTPLYSPLINAIELNGREVVSNPLISMNNTYEIDFENLEKAFLKGVKVMILCSPHNPVGRVWNMDELMKLGELCEKYSVILISDEVHADFTFTKQHIPVAKVQKLRERVIVCTSPAKTFNLPGLEVANIIIPNRELREGFEHNIKKAGIFNPTYFAVPALEQAYCYEDQWLEQLKCYIMKNYSFVKEFIQDNLPLLQVIQSEGTYLMWIDCRKLSLSESDLKKWFYQEANVAVSMGSSFGEGGEGFIRLNVATPRSLLEKAMANILSSYPLNKTLERKF